MKKRGNNDCFIERMTETKAWKRLYEENINDLSAKYKIELKSGQFLSDIKNYFL